LGTPWSSYAAIRINVHHLDLSDSAGGNVKWYSNVRKQVLFSKKLNDLAILVIGINSRKMKAYVHIKTYT
jgi:hypothetical protein